MENREIVKDELNQLLETYYNGSFAELVGDFIRHTGMTQQELERMVEEIRRLKGG